MRSKPNKPLKIHAAALRAVFVAAKKKLVLVGRALYDKHETGMFCKYFQHFVAPKLVQRVNCGCYWQLNCKKKNASVG